MNSEGTGVEEADDTMLAAQLRCWERFFAVRARLLLRDPTTLSHRTTSSCVKILPKILLQQRRDLTLYYTGLDVSTPRMQRCPPLNLWFSAARASVPRDHSAVKVRYMDTVVLRQRRSACTGTGLRLRIGRSQWKEALELTFLSGVGPLCGRCHFILFALVADAGGRWDGCMLLHLVWRKEWKAVRHLCSQVLWKEIKATRRERTIKIDLGFLKSQILTILG